MNDDELDLGACCACGRVKNARNVMLLDKKAPVPGTGWGCVVCHLPHDGAVAILCDSCLRADKSPIYAVKGFPKDGLRIPVGELTGTHEHNLEVDHG